MKAVILKATGELEVGEVDRPTIGSGEGLVQVTHSGVCGTDLKIYQGGIPVHHPLIMGHEMTGTLVEVAEGSSLEPGTRVLVNPVTSCGNCFHCRIGQDHLCLNGALLGRDRNGGFAEYVVAPLSNIFPLPSAVDSKVAPLIQVFTTCMHAQRHVDVFPGQSVVVMGLGVSGLLHVQLAKARGAYPVIGVTRSAWKREMAAELGADITLESGDEAREGVLEATNGLGADLVVEAAGHASTLIEGVHLARIGGTMLVFGIITAKEIALPFYQLYYKELAVINARAARNEDYPASIELVERGVINMEPMVTQVLPLDNLDEALGMLASSEARRMKIILEH